VTDKPQIVCVLEDAQLAHRSGDFVNALKFYEHFFDHALDDDPYALYGVRLSHCLQGWAELAAQFPGAKSRLEYKKRDSLEFFLQHKDPERFHDYLTICRHLGLESDALEEFLKLHKQLPKTAAKLVKYLWDDLINAEQWSTCNELLVEPAQKMDELFSVYDEAARLKDFDPAFDNIKFDQHIVDTLLQDVQNLVLVLRQGDRGDDIASAHRQFSLGVQARDHATLHKQVHAKASFLFAHH
jgi:hypothetical protein